MKTNELGKRLRDLREGQAFGNHQSKLTQRQVAADLNITPAAYASWEVGRTFPSVQHLPQIATYFGVTTDYLLGHQISNKLVNKQEKIIWSAKGFFQTKNEIRGLKAWELLNSGVPLEEIAEELGITFSAEKEIERIIKDLVFANKIRIEQLLWDIALSNRLKEKYRLSAVRVLKTFESSPDFYKKLLIGEMARIFFKETIRPGMRVGLAGGSTVSSFVYALQRGDCQSIEVYPLATSPVASQAIAALDANTLAGTFAYRHEGYDVRGFTLQYTSKQSRLRGSHAEYIGLTQWILNKAKGIDIGFVGVGNLQFNLPPFDLFNNLPNNTMQISEAIKVSGAVGDLLFSYLDKNGETIETINVNTDGEIANFKFSDFTCALELSDLRQIVQAGIPIVILAAGEKADIVRVSLQSGYANTLIIDTQLAHKLLNN